MNTKSEQQHPTIWEGESKDWPLHKFHITLHFEGGFKNISRSKANGACLVWLWTMNIKLGMNYANPFDIGLNIIIKNWVGFLKLHSKYPQNDGIALLKSERAFTMEMEDGEKTKGKVEKGFELTKAWNLRHHIQGIIHHGNPHMTSSSQSWGRATMEEGPMNSWH